MKKLNKIFTSIETAPKLFYFLIFLVAFIVHLIGLNQIGRTWDEEYKLDYGHLAWNLISVGDFSEGHWNVATEHPMVAKYIYGYAQSSQALLLKNAFTGMAITEADYNRTLNDNSIITTIGYNTYLIPYDYTFARILSAIFNSLAVMLTVMIAGIYMSKRWSLLPGLFLLLTPRLVVLGQLATFESISVFLFCLLIIVFKRLFEKPNKLLPYIDTGILSGLFFWTRYNNIIVFPFLAGWLGINFLETKNKKIFNWKLFLIPLIAFFLGIAIWPTQWHSFPKYLLDSLSYHQNRFVGLSFYYWQYFLLATSIPLLAAFFVGIFVCLKERNYKNYLLLWWVGLTIILYSIFCIKLGGTRYVVILYPSIAIIATIGFKKFLRKNKLLLLIPVLLFMFYEQSKAFPYYLDYYNQFIGRSGAIHNNLDFSWWGEGQREAGLWLRAHGAKKSKVGLLVVPKYVFPRLRQDQTTDFIEKPNNSDYIVVTRSVKIPSDFYKNYTLVFTVTTENEALVYIYKKKMR